MIVAASAVALFVTAVMVAGLLLAMDNAPEVARWLLVYPATRTRAYGLLVPAPGLVMPKRGRWSASFSSVFRPRWTNYSGEWRRIGRVVFLWSAPPPKTKTRLSFKPGFGFQ